MNLRLKICAAAGLLTLAGLASAVSADPNGGFGGPNPVPPPAPMWVTCTSQGEVCDQHATLAGPRARSWLNLTAPPQHCSSVIYTVKFVGARLFPGGPPRVLSEFTTRALGPNETQRTGVDTRAFNILIYAQGVPGGCNQGQLASWGVIADIEPYIG